MRKAIVVQSDKETYLTTWCTMFVHPWFSRYLCVVSNCSTVQPIFAVERAVFWERATRMYYALPCAASEVWTGGVNIMP